MSECPPSTPFIQPSDPRKSLVMFAENVTCHHISSHSLLHILKDQEGLTRQQKKILDLYFEERAWKAQCGVLVAL